MVSLARHGEVDPAASRGRRLSQAWCFRLAQGQLASRRSSAQTFQDGYRTSYLVRRLPSGDLDFIGRNDSQVKIQGHRVELDGVKSLLGRHPEVRDAAIVLTRDDGGDGVLTAFYTADRDLDPAALRALLAASLHAEIIPRHFVRLPQLPLRESGKVDAEAPRRRASEREVNEAFLATTFAKAPAQQTSYIRERDGGFRAARSVGAAPEAAVRPIHDRFDRRRIMGEVLDELGIERSFANVQRARVMLTTPAFPHLVAVTP